jgi:dTDP-4-dehydrorhamnose 3,5-epimerase
VIIVKNLVKGVKFKQLKVISDERGRLIEMLRNDDKDFFTKFGQLYATTVYPGVVKGWHYHKKQTDNFIVISGMVKVVLYDSRKGSPTYRQISEFFMGEHNFSILQIPPLVYHGFKGIGTKEAIVICCPTEVYNYKKPDEFRIPPRSKKVPYNWALEEG